MMPPTKAMLLCAGLGKRMRPLTDHRPKPLIEVCGRTLLDRALDDFVRAGVREVMVNTHYKAEMIEAHVARRPPPPAISLSHEPVLLETGGGIKKALPWLGDDAFYCANGDAICVDGSMPAWQRLADAWDARRMDALLLLVPRENARGYEGPGDFFLEGQGMLRRRGEALHAPCIFSGLQLLHPRLFSGAPEGAFSMNLLYDRCRPRVCGVLHDGPWLHVGDPAGLAQAEHFLLNRP